MNEREFERIYREVLDKLRYMNRQELERLIIEQIDRMNTLTEERNKARKELDRLEKNPTWNEPNLFKLTLLCEKNSIGLTSTNITKIIVIQAKNEIELNEKIKQEIDQFKLTYDFCSLQDISRL